LAGEALASVWSKTVIDGYPVIAQYCDPDEHRLSIPPPSEEWIMEHVRQSQYCLQIVRCNNIDCCGEWRTNLLDIFPDRFLPAPVKFINYNNGVVASNVDDDQGRFGSLSQRIMLGRLQPKTDFKQFLIDFYCKSIRDQLAKRICPKRGLYFPSQAGVKRHAPVHKNDRLNLASLLSNNDQSPHRIVNRPMKVPVYENIYELIQSPFEQDDDNELEF
jgi:hypothetical protein